VEVGGAAVDVVRIEVVVKREIGRWIIGNERTVVLAAGVTIRNSGPLYRHIVSVSDVE
jgi:hypothetical protein